MQLWKIAEQYRADVAKLQNFDLPPETVMDTIEAMQGEVIDKIKAVMIVSMEMDALADARAKCAKEMAESAKNVANRAENLRSYAQITMQNCGIPLPFVYPEFTVGLQKNPPSCEVRDLDKVPEEFKVTTVSFSATGAKTAKWIEDVTKWAEATAKSHGTTVTAPTIATAPNKRAILASLKTDPNSVSGSHLNADSFRITVK